jgi:hypothetical protein
MNKVNLSLLAAAAVALGFAMVGCEKKEGPMERAGKSVDKAVEKAGDKIERAGDKIQDAAKGK